MGTWQLSGEFKDMSENYKRDLLFYAYENGVRKFDTAYVYGEGSVEMLLGNVFGSNNDVDFISKLPANRKPNINDDNVLITDYYDPYIMRIQLGEILDRLKRDFINTILLHNWHPSWGIDNTVFDTMLSFRNEGLCKKIGVSLPNRFENDLDLSIVDGFDVIEIPYNAIEKKWSTSILKQHHKKKSFLIRSLFSQGKFFHEDNGDLMNFYSPSDINTYIRSMLCFGSVVLGMTNKNQIFQNLNSIK